MGMIDSVPSRPRKGRGAIGNAAGRFERLAREAVDDGWGTADAEPPALRTSVTIETPRRIISRNRSPDIAFDQSINPYRGCEHGCVYCYARPTHAYLGLSPGLDFESRLFAKPNAAALLESELAKPGYVCSPIMLGSNTDPYQPIERGHKITRAILKVLAAHNHPVAIATKSALVLRDLDILAPMAEKGLAAAALSVTTLDRGLARKLEPRAATPARRLDAIRGLSAAGVPTSVLAAPMIPALNDHELEAIIRAGAEAGASGAFYTLLRLPLELKDLFSGWLETHAPDRARHVLNQLAESRGGQLYQASFKSRMTGEGPHAEMLAKRFRAVVKRLGLRASPPAGLGLDCRRFARPPQAGDQLGLFD